MSLNQGSLQHTDKNDTGSSSFNFELEYDVSHRSVRDILQHILRDWSSQKQLHSWDEKIYATPLKAVRIACQELFKRDNGTYSCDLVLSEAAAEEVLTLKGANQKRPHIQEAAEDVGGHLFFSKVNNDPRPKFPAQTNKSSRYPLKQNHKPLSLHLILVMKVQTW